MARPFAQLIEDGGSSAGGGIGGHPSEFFRGAHFLEAEGATHTLRIETGSAELLARAVEARGRATWMLAGGRTPRTIYARLAASPLRDRVPWEAIEVYFGDERHAPAARIYG